MIVKGITVGLLAENCYILGCEESRAGVIIDPGDDPRSILALVRDEGLTIEKILNTHAHFDHLLALNAVRKATRAPFYLHELELPLLRDVSRQAEMWLGMEVSPIADPDEFLLPGQIITFGQEALEVRFTPGHSPGHVVFVDQRNGQIFGGDTLFQGSIGRFDLPGADGPTLLNSITQELLTLPDDFVVYPGHGEPTEIGFERLHNPFVGENGHHTR